jgi:ABC-type nitrate/sulfonate/bicarbonate transport system substrate-binding protein
MWNRRRSLRVLTTLVLSATLAGCAPSAPGSAPTTAPTKPTAAPKPAATTAPAAQPAAVPAKPTDAPKPAAESKPPTRIVQAGFKVLYMWPLFVAKERGFFAEEGIEFEWAEVESGALGVASLVSGNAQFTDMGINDAANLRREGKDLLLVYRLMRRVTLDMVFRTEVADRLNLSREMPLVDRFKALKDLKIGITRPGAVTDVIARYYLKQAGLEPDRDANLVPIGAASALVAALRTGAIDTYLLSPPSPQQLEREGVGKIVIMSSAGDVPQLADVPFASITVTKEYAEKNPEIVRSYVRAVQKAFKFGSDNREEGLRIAAQYFADTPADVLALSWDALLPAISGDGAFTEQGSRDYLQIMVDMGQLESLPPTEEGVLWTNAFVR